MSDDRAAILRRRAFFVSSAVAVLGSCARTAPPAEPTSPPEINVPEGDPDAGATDAALPSSDRDAPRADGPPLDVPAGVSETAREKYERLASVMTRAYGILDQIEADLPSCSILDPSCEPRFRRVADQLNELDGLFQRFFVCGGASEEAKAYGEREKAHQEHYRKRRAGIEGQIESELSKDGERGRARWDALRREAYQAAPFPCLKFACPEW
jgi:hypothetical protein